MVYQVQKSYFNPSLTCSLGIIQVDKLINLDGYYLVRRVPLGLAIAFMLLAVVVSNISLGVNISDILGYSNILAVGALVICIYFIGFMFDLFGLYKMHPLYTKQREKFFLSIFLCINPNSDITSIKERIKVAEMDRENLIYRLGEKRLKDIKLEMAAWVMLYNVSCAAWILCLVQLILSVFQKNYSSFSISTIIVLAIIGLITGIIARNRNTSYNDKIIYWANEAPVEG